MTLAAMSISFGGNIFILVLFLLALIAAAILFYRYTLPPLPGKKRFLLSALRALALCLLLGILFEPVLRSITTTEQPPIVAMLVDVSQSMSIHDGTGDRSGQLFQFIHQKNLIPPQTQIEYFPFAENLHPPQSALRDTFPLEGEVTNISDASCSIKRSVEPSEYSIGCSGFGWKLYRRKKSSVRCGRIGNSGLYRRRRRYCRNKKMC